MGLGGFDCIIGLCGLVCFIEPGGLRCLNGLGD